MRFFIAFLLFTIVCIAKAPLSYALTMGFDSSWFGSVTSGNSYTVDVFISEFPAGEIVSAYDLDVLYSSSLLSATAVTFNANNWLGDPVSFEAIRSFDLGTSGLVDLAEVSLLWDSELEAIQSAEILANDALILATITFDAIDDGIPLLAFEWTAGNDVKGLNGEVLYDGPPPIPEPGTLLLFGSAMAMLASCRRKYGA